MISFKYVWIMLFLLGSFFPNVAYGRKVTVKHEKASVITNPSDSRDKRILLSFNLSEDIFDSKTIVDFALLICKAQINDAIAGQIGIFPVTTNWENENDVLWNDPWENPGGDFSEEYLSSNYTLRSKWGKKEISIDVTKIVQDWKKGVMDNNGLIAMLSQDDLENYPLEYVLDLESIELKIFYSYEYK